MCERKSVASHISKTSEAIAEFDTVTASVTRMHHMLIILTVTIIQGHTDLNHENNKCGFYLYPFLFLFHTLRHKHAMHGEFWHTANGQSALIIIAIMNV